jgi:transmembrane sensor
MTEGDQSGQWIEQAMDWLMRLRDAPADPALHAQFRTWLAQGPETVSAWERAQETWRLLGEIPAHRAGSRASPADIPRRHVWRVGAAFAALAAVLLLAILAPSLLLRLKADHWTAAGEVRHVTLTDGSTVHLGPESAIDVDYASGRRRIALLAGEAFFEVAANPGRPFVVDAAGLDVTVVGTAFDIRVSPGALAVGVRNGTVAVRYARASPALDAKLEGGDRVTVDRATGVAVRDRIAPDDVASWRDGRLFVDNATVAEVVEQLRQYQDGWIIVADDSLAARRVTGLYDLHDTGRALRALVRPVGGEVREITPYVRILSLP